LAGIGDVVLAVLAIAGQTNSATLGGIPHGFAVQMNPPGTSGEPGAPPNRLRGTTLDLFLPISGILRGHGGVMDGPSWLHNDDDSVDMHHYVFIRR